MKCSTNGMECMYLLNTTQREIIQCNVLYRGKYIMKNFISLMRSFAQEKKSQQTPEIDALVRDRKVFAWCHKIN